MQAVPSTPEMRRWLAPVLILVAAAACAAGLVASGAWRALPAARFGESLALAGLVALLARALRTAWRRPWADVLALVWLAMLPLMAGVLPVLAVMLLVAGAGAIGGWLTGDRRPALALLAGLALIAGVLGWLLPLPLHHRPVYAAMLVVPAVLRRDALRAQWMHARAGWRDAVDGAPPAAAWGVVLLGLASAATWLPTMQHDDLAYHLGLPWQLMLHARYALDPTHQVWALAPWAGDVLQAVPQVLARAESRGPVNLAWLVVAAAGLWRLSTQLGLAVPWRWGVLALYASLPPVVAVLTGMQTETPAIAVTLWLAALLSGSERRSDVLAAGLLFGLLAALKPVHALAALPVLLLAWRHGRASAPAGARPAPRLLAGGGALALAVAVPSSSYLTAWRITGNPLLPLFNARFGSPYFPAVDFDDPRWHAGFGPLLPWHLSFSTDRYYEAWPGGFGFVLVALAGAWLVALCTRRTRALALAGSAALLLPLAGLQYARYALPGLVLLLPALVAALQAHLAPRLAATVLVAVCAANLAYQANANWILHTGGIKRAVGALGRDEPLFARYSPERVLAARIRAVSPDAVVLDLAGPSVAEYAGAGRTLDWYDPRLHAAATAADADPTGAGWAALVRASGARELVLRPGALSAAQRAGLASLRAAPAATVGEAQWWRLPGVAR